VQEEVLINLALYERDWTPERVRGVKNAVRMLLAFGYIDPSDSRVQGVQEAILEVERMVEELHSPSRLAGLMADEKFSKFIQVERERCSFVYLDGSVRRRCGCDTLARIAHGTDQESKDLKQSYYNWVNACVTSVHFGDKFFLGPDVVYRNGYELLRKLEQFFIDVAAYYGLEFPKPVLVNEWLPIIWLKTLEDGSIGPFYQPELGTKISQALLCLFDVDSLEKVYGALNNLCSTMWLGVLQVMHIQWGILFGC
jgi:hypothetical protein